jgi:hypothetical protein
MRLRGPRNRIKARGGFTLLETALAMIIVMVGVVAMVEAHGSMMRANSWSSQEATATYLANELRERMRNLARHDPVSGISLNTGGGGPPTAQGVGPETGEVTVTDYDDIDDYDGAKFGPGGNFEGPIDAFGRVIPDIDFTGVVRINPGTGQPFSLQGWRQEVVVEKIDAFDFASVRQWNATDPPSGNFVGRNVDQFPLRVKVSVLYQAPLSTVADKVTEVSWIVPAF